MDDLGLCVKDRVNPGFYVFSFVASIGPEWGDQATAGSN